MHNWLVDCSQWLERSYLNHFGDTSNGLELRWVDADDLTREMQPADAGAIAISDPEIGWVFFFLPFSADRSIAPSINQALGLRAKLAREFNYTGTPTPQQDEDLDAWQVGLVWLVSKSQENAWQSEVATLRHESGASEEISFDLVIIDDDGASAALDRHELPRLMLSSRTLLRKEPQQVDRWLSADNEVAERLIGFSSHFDTPRARAHARWLEEQVSTASPISETALGTPIQFEGFSVENFRNLANLEIAPPSKEVETIVLFGPNGTGKSSLIEALSLAAFRRSPRSDEYFEDKDESSRSGNRFVDRYLSPLDSGGLTATYRWGNGIPKPFALNNSDRSTDPDGVILDQDSGRAFSSLKADELAEKVLHGYSELAQRLSDELDRRADSAKLEKQAFFRQYDLSSAITRSETAYDRLATSVLEQVKPIPSGFLDWANRTGRTDDPIALEIRTLEDRWLSFNQSLPSVGQSMAKLQSIGASDPIAAAIKETLERYNELSQLTRNVIERWESRYGELKNETSELLARLDAWGEYLSRPKDPLQAESSTAALAKEIETLARHRNEIAIKGKDASARLELLEKTHLFLQSHWTKDHPDSCPVCSSQIDALGGIQAVVQELKSQCLTERDELRGQYAAQGKVQEELENRLKALSTTICPISPDDQDRLRTLIVPFLEGNPPEVALASATTREKIKQDLLHAMRPLSKPELYPASDVEASRLANEFMKLCDTADSVLAEPNALEEVRKKYQSILKGIIEHHLPETLGSVWKEIAGCLTAAHWLLPGVPTMKLEAGRGRQNHRLSLKVGNSDRLARYVFNAAELQTLGLAWFFTFHLARRRFEHNWIALDDPAQDLDQTSFRELTRFLATWQRLFRRANQRHTLLIALHQEERALDTTRATDAQLYLLGWSPAQKAAGPTSPGIRKKILLAPGYHPKRPSTLFTPVARSHIDT